MDQLIEKVIWTLGAKLEQYQSYLTHLTGMILSYGKLGFEMRCGASDKSLSVAIRQKNPAFAVVLYGFTGVLRHLSDAPHRTHDAPARKAIQDHQIESNRTDIACLNIYERGQFLLERKKSYEAAIKLRTDAKRVSDKFIQWYKSPE